MNAYRKDLIPISVVVTTLNEAKNLPRCLSALRQFDEVVVVDSSPLPSEQERSATIVSDYGRHFISFEWNGKYPKKRQWCLDHIPLKYNRVFFVDADEEVMPELEEEIAHLEWEHAGYLVTGYNVVSGKILRKGPVNKKIALFDCTMMAFPVVNDLDIEGMGEIEGHYQPVFQTSSPCKTLGQLECGLLHYACENRKRWQDRHQSYRLWRKTMEERNAFPEDPSRFRQILKMVLRKIPRKDIFVFIYYFFFRGGFLEGRDNLMLCLEKKRYFRD